MSRIVSSKHGFKRTSFNFYERQYFKNRYIQGFLILSVLFLLYMLIEQELSDRLWGMKPIDTALLVAIIVLIAVPLLIIYSTTHLDTIINDDGIFFRWRPYKKSYNIFDWTAINEVSIIEIKGKMFGFGKSRKYGEFHYTGGRFALLMKMRNGKKKVIGTHKPEELNRILISLGGDKYRNTTGYSFDYS